LLSAQKPFSGALTSPKKQTALKWILNASENKIKYFNTKTLNLHEKLRVFNLFNNGN